MITTKSFIKKSWDGRDIEYISKIILKNGKELKLPDKISFYIELQTKILVLTYYPTEDLPVDKEDIYRNIFCYDKETGREIWQVESQEESPYVEVGVDFPGLAEDNIDCEQIRNENMVIGLIINQKIRKQIDRLEARTFDCNKYYIDIETGKVEWFGYTK